MKVNNANQSVGMHQQVPASPNDAMVQRIMEAERAPIEGLQRRREGIDQDRQQLSSIQSMFQELGNSAESIAQPNRFSKMKVESSNPEIVDAKLTGNVAPGSYEIEVNGLARSQKLVDAGFPDADKTPVGFGYMAVESDSGKTTEITIPPGATLSDVATAINESGAEVKAQVINTGRPEDPYRLMVQNQKSGSEARVHLDEDTTHLNFEEISKPRDLAMKFEGVDVQRSKNEVGDLIEGLSLETKKAAPGTLVKLDVKPDVDSTLEGIKQFVDKYNTVAGFAHKQFTARAEDRQANASSDSMLRSAMRGLQSQVVTASNPGGKFQNLTDLGITTNAKTGELQVNEDKLKKALAEDYDGVKNMFANSDAGPGLASRLSQAVKHLQDPASGSLRMRQKTLDRQIDEQDKQIDRRMRALEEREAHVRSQVERMQQNIAKIETQQASFGGAPAAAMPGIAK